MVELMRLSCGDQHSAWPKVAEWNCSRDPCRKNVKLVPAAAKSDPLSERFAAYDGGGSNDDDEAARMRMRASGTGIILEQEPDETNLGSADHQPHFDLDTPLWYL